MCCALNVFVFAILCQSTLLQSLNSDIKPLISTREYNNTLNEIVVLGKGIEEIPEGSGRVLVLNLAYNHLSSLPEFVFWNKSYQAVTKIELYQNKINKIDVSAFRGLKQLTKVIISDNNLTFLDSHTFKHNPKLEKVDLSGNKIRFDRLMVFLIHERLETLILSHNRIEQLYELTFNAVPNLKNLILDNNSLSMIAPKSFNLLSKLQYLSLANTGVYRLSESMFGHNLPRIVDLRETPIAKRFDPQLKVITNNAVKSLIKFDQNLFK